MSESRPSVAARGLDVDPNAPAKPSSKLFQLASYLVHVNNELLLAWFVGAVLTKINLGDSYEPNGYNFTIEGILILSVLKFLTVVLRAFTKTKGEKQTNFNLLLFFDFGILVGWGIVFVVGEILRAGNNSVERTDLIESFYISVFRKWCYVFISVLICFAVLEVVSRFLAKRSYNRQLDDI